MAVYDSGRQTTVKLPSCQHCAAVQLLCCVWPVLFLSFFLLIYLRISFSLPLPPFSSSSSSSSNTPSASSYHRRRHQPHRLDRIRGSWHRVRSANVITERRHGLQRLRELRLNQKIMSTELIELIRLKNERVLVAVHWEMHNYSPRKEVFIART